MKKGILKVFFLEKKNYLLLKLLKNYFKDKSLVKNDFEHLRCNQIYSWRFYGRKCVEVYIYLNLFDKKS